MAFCDLFKEFHPIQVDEDIYLRQHEPEQDAKSFWEIYHDEENFKYYSGYRKPQEWNEEREIRAEASRVKGFKGKREYSWVVTYQGINTKVLKAVCRFGMEIMGLERIEAYTRVDNIGSNRTLQKVGFTKEGLLRKRFMIKDTLGDCIAYSFVKADLEQIME